MYISWNIDESSVWESCISSSMKTLTTWDWLKTISLKFRDITGNESSIISKTTTLSTLVSWSCTSLPTNGLYYWDSISYNLSSASNWTTLDASIAWYNVTPTNNSCEWKCNSGYEKSGYSCIKKIYIPPNAHTYGSSWKCNSGYYKNQKWCSKLPSNASAFGSGEGFYCKSGYKKSGSQCIKRVSIPANAYASTASKGWLIIICKTGRKK